MAEGAGNVLKEVLAIRIAVSGLTELDKGMSGLGQTLKNVADATSRTAGAVASLAAAFTAMSIAVREATVVQQMTAHMSGLTGSMKLAREQMMLIQDISFAGVFHQGELAESFKLLNAAGISLDENLDTILKLGGRGGSLTGATRLVRRIEGTPFQVPELVRQTQNVGITGQKFIEQGLPSVGYSVFAGRDEIMRAIRDIEEFDTILIELGNTFPAVMFGTISAAKALASELGAPLLKPLTEVLKIVRTLFVFMVDLARITPNWVKGLIAAGGIVFTLTKVVVLLKMILATEKGIAIVAGIRAALQGGAGLLSGMKAVLTTLRAIFSIETLLKGVELVRALLAAAWAAAIGNIPGAMIALGLIAAAGVGVYYANRAVGRYREGKGGLDGLNDEAANRAVRRDDIENAYKRAYGEVWTG